MSREASFVIVDGHAEMPGRLGFKPILFNENAYLDTKVYHDLKTFLAIDAAGAIVARVRFAKRKEGSIWESLPLAPHGAIEMVEGFDVARLLQFISNYFEGESIVRIRLTPVHNQGVEEVFESCGFRGSIGDINHHVDLNGEINIHKMELRRYKKAEQAGCEFSEIQLNLDSAFEIHHFIARCRVQQGLEINISESEFIETVRLLPEYYSAFTVRLNDEIIAATVVVKVNNRVAYNYLPASNKAFHHLSPMVYLTIHLYHQLKRLGFQIMDWGLTSVKGEEQTGLAHFKEAMGAQLERRFTYVLAGQS
ncbi:MAG: GNAT family N-acetyltransferase [Bacteroidota bacterium]